MLPVRLVFDTNMAPEALGQRESARTAAIGVFKTHGALAKCWASKRTVSWTNLRTCRIARLLCVAKSADARIRDLGRYSSSFESSHASNLKLVVGQLRSDRRKVLLVSGEDEEQKLGFLRHLFMFLQ